MWYLTPDGYSTLPLGWGESQYCQPSYSTQVILFMFIHYVSMSDNSIFQHNWFARLNIDSVVIRSCKFFSDFISVSFVFKGRNPGRLFVAATKDRFDDYNGVWLTEYETRFYEWVHVAVTITHSNKMKIYIDGKFLKSTTLDTPSIPTQVRCSSKFLVQLNI